MSIIRPSSELRNNYNEIADLCREKKEPVFLTRNGTGDMVLLTEEQFEHLSAMELKCQLQEGLLDIANGDYITLDELKEDLDKEFSDENL